MAKIHPTATTLTAILVLITGIISTSGNPKPWPENLQSLEITPKLTLDPAAIHKASTDYGKIETLNPAAVLRPTSINDIVSLIKSSFNSPSPFPISARGCGHSLRGQAMAKNGVVIETASLKYHRNHNGVVVSGNPSSGFYADVAAELMWIDVLDATLEYGLAPVSWTDYLYLSVGGTLSNGGISGQTFRFGPQISNVYELDVITGKGEFMTCSPKENSELFHGVLGGLGQFGIITRARIRLNLAPTRVKWMRMLYDNFGGFIKDQEKLVSMNGNNEKNNGLDYLEGFVIQHQGSPNNWRSSFFPLSDHSRIISLVTNHGIVYCLEIAVSYGHHNQSIVDEELEVLLKGLKYIHGFMYEKDVLYVDFLNRVRSGELKLQSQGLWDVPHPWLNLFVPKSGILNFNSHVFKDILVRRNITTGPVLIYPMHRNKWDDKMSTAIPEEDVFYSVGFLHSSGFDDWGAYIDQNKEILEFCENNGIRVKQYLPHYRTKEEWGNHFGSKWKRFQERKSQFDPKMILSPGQRIFNKF